MHGFGLHILLKKTTKANVSLPCGDAPANLMKTKLCRVVQQINIITYETFEVNWLRALSLVVCRSYLI